MRRTRPALRPPKAVAVLLAGLCAMLAAGCDEIKVDRRQRARPDESTPATASAERHLDGIRRLTDAGLNRQASFNGDGSRIVWLCQSGPATEFGISVMNADGGSPAPVETGSETLPAPSTVRTTYWAAKSAPAE